MRHLQKIGFLLFCAPLITFSALAAEPYPVRPVKIIAPQAPGGGVDIVGRIIADQLRIATGQSFLIDNQAGAGGAIAAKMTARAAPDGYTLMIGYVATHGTNPAVKKNIYDPIKDFTAIGMIGGTPNILVASKTVPVKTLQEFITYAKANPSKADYGTSGVGTLNHLLMEEFKTVSGIPSMAVPYRSIGQAFTDSIGGQIQVIFPGLSAAMPHIREGSFKPLAITGEKRNPLMPNVPTFKESGFEGFNSLTWYGIVGPPGLPIAIRDQLNKTLAQILAKPEVQKLLADQAITIMPMTPDRFEKYITAEVKHWTEVARVSKVEAD
jgi:tripartite-type tricarboxylate transporter receptor subunit TctC